MKAKTSITWINESVRPYESLWSIGQRFFYFNHINSKQFADEYFSNHRFSPFSPTYGFNAAHFNYEKFRVALGISKSIFKNVTLDFLNNTFVNHSSHELKYCPECLKSAYHSAFFQLKWLDVCPIHGEMLKVGCSNCNKGLNLTFKSGTIQNPYACQYCGWNMLVDCQVLFNPPEMPEAKKMKVISKWCLHLSEVDKKIGVIDRLLFDKPFSNADWFFPIINELADYPVPRSLSKSKCSFIQESRTQVTFGFRESKPNMRYDAVQEESDLLTHLKNEDSFNAIYKSYRRYLVKHELGTNKKLLPICAVFHPLNILDKYPDQFDLIKKALAISLLMNYVKKVGLVLDRTSILRSRRFGHAYKLILLSNHSSLTKAYALCRNRQELYWVNLHCYFEELRGLYKEALIASQEMLENEKIYSEPWMIRGRLLPCSFFSHTTTNQLCFISVQKKVDKNLFSALDPNSD